MDTDKSMEMVRVPREDRIYEREALFGRDACAVFPSEAKKAKQQQLDELKKAVGLDNSRFITESELEEIKKTRGGRVEDGAVLREKTLAAVLAENKAKKEEAFQEVWKTMKQGKNRPLDEEDLAFVNSLVDSDQAKERIIRDAEKNDLESFHEAVRRAAEQRQQEVGTSAAPAEKESHQRQTKATTLNRPLIRVRQKGGAGKRPGESMPAGEAMKRHRSEDEQLPDTSDPDILAGLVSGYASDSESDS